MKQIKDKALLSQYIEKNKIHEYFKVCHPDFMLFRYEPGELLTNPFSPSKYLQFVVEGTLLMYDMPDEDSTIVLQTSYNEVGLLGEVELIDTQFVPFFVEASSVVYSVAFDLELHRSQLLEDPAFLLKLCKSLATKLNGAVVSSSSLPLKKRIANYINYSYSEGYIKNISAIAKMLNASNRQLIRVLKQYCEEGVLDHESKGTYKILKKVVLN